MNMLKVQYNFLQKDILIIQSFMSIRNIIFPDYLNLFQNNMMENICQQFFLRLNTYQLIFIALLQEIMSR